MEIYYGKICSGKRPSPQKQRGIMLGEFLASIISQIYKPNCRETGQTYINRRSRKAASY